MIKLISLTILVITVTHVTSLGLPANLMIEAFDSKIPVYRSLLELFGNTILGQNTVNITATSLILIVVANIILGSR